MIEGRIPNLYIAASVAESLDQKAEYVKNKGLTDKYYQDLIIKYLTQWEKGKKSDFVNLLKDKLPDSLTAHQKEAKVKNYLQSLRRADKIMTQSTSSGKRSRIWILVKNISHG